MSTANNNPFMICSQGASFSSVVRAEGTVRGGCRSAGRGGFDTSAGALSCCSVDDNEWAAASVFALAAAFFITRVKSLGGAEERSVPTEPCSNEGDLLCSAAMGAEEILSDGRRRV